MGPGVENGIIEQAASASWNQSRVGKTAKVGPMHTLQGLGPRMPIEKANLAPLEPCITLSVLVKRCLFTGDDGVKSKDGRCLR